MLGDITDSGAGYGLTLSGSQRFHLFNSVSTRDLVVQGKASVESGAVLRSGTLDSLLSLMR
jgi:hypothetical protein